MISRRHFLALGGAGLPGPPSFLEAGVSEHVFHFGTASARPVLRCTWEARWRRRAVSVVEAEVNGDVYEFTFARDSHLLVRLVAPPPGPNTPWECQLADYTSVEGIPLPGKVTEILASGIKATDRNTYALNVDYDEAIFVAPPSLARGPKGWRRP